MTPPPETPIDLFARALAGAVYRGFATQPDIRTRGERLREVYATEAKTVNQAMAKVKPNRRRPRLTAYLVSGRYRDELADARWVA